MEDALRKLLFANTEYDTSMKDMKTAFIISFLEGRCERERIDRIIQKSNPNEKFQTALNELKEYLDKM